MITYPEALIFLNRFEVTYAVVLMILSTTFAEK
jgi:hypothetical protein